MNSNVNLSPNLVIIEFFSRFSPGFLGLIILFLFFIQILMLFGVSWSVISSVLEDLKDYNNIILMTTFFLAYFIGTIIKEISFKHFRDEKFPYVEAVKETFKESFPEQKYKEIVTFYEEKFPGWGQNQRIHFDNIENRPYNDVRINKDLYYFDYCKKELKISSLARAELQLMEEAIIRFFLALQALSCITSILALIIIFVSIVSFYFSDLLGKNIIVLISIICSLNIIILFTTIRLVELIRKPIQRKRFWESISLWTNYYEYYELKKTSGIGSTNV